MYNYRSTLYNTYWYLYEDKDARSHSSTMEPDKNKPPYQEEKKNEEEKKPSVPSTSADIAKKGNNEATMPKLTVETLLTKKTAAPSSAPPSSDGHSKFAPRTHFISYIFSLSPFFFKVKRAAMTANPR